MNASDGAEARSGSLRRLEEVGALDDDVVTPARIPRTVTAGELLFPDGATQVFEGRVASSVDNGLMESFWSTVQRELLDRQRWATRADLGSAIFKWIEACYNPRRRHSALGYLSPVHFEKIHTAALTPA